ncbi:MAG: tRNA lysidine(34) synthetase TilS [Clostridia bacterium]|nr:tRNA lysidine(34) synthetase TilS [Clostridia bacterium]
MLKKYRGNKICVAVSGGSDSVALLHYLNALKKENGYSLSAVHCEHGIRGEDSLADMQFVKSLCEEWGVELYVFQEDCPARAKKEKESLETAARNFRYQSFRTLIREGKADFIATAHHKNDEAETVLFRLARGTSLGGMSAMKEENGYLLRPFLKWSKKDIHAYIQEHGLSFCEDKTNLETDATRNKIRLEVLPKLEEAVSGATENIARFASLAMEDDALLYELAEKLLERDEKDYYIAFSDKKPLFTRACLMAFKALGLEKDYTSAHLDAVFALQYAERGARLDLPKKIRAEKLLHAVCIYLSKEEEYAPLGEEKPFEIGVFNGGRYEVTVSKEEPTPQEDGWKTLRFDEEKLPKSAIFRFRREGDKIKAFSGDTKSLKKLFNEKKIPVRERGYIPLLAEKDGETVYAVCGVEISEKIKVDENTKNVVYISIRKRGKV